MPIGVSTRLASEIVTAVQRQFGDESGTQINTTDIIRWINQGQLQIARRIEAYKSTATTPSVAGQTAYSFPSDQILVINGIFYADTPLQYISFEQAQASILSSSNFSSIQNTPTTYYEWDDSIYLYPVPKDSGDTIKLFVVKQPTIVTTVSDALTLPDTHFEALLQYCLSQAYELDDDFSSAGAKSQQLEASLNNLADVATYKYYPVITISPEDQ